MAEEKMEAVPVIITGPDGQEREYVEEKVIPFAGEKFAVLVALPDYADQVEDGLDMTFAVHGRRVVDGVSVVMQMTSSRMYPIIQMYLEPVAELAERIIREASPDMAEDLLKHGLLLTGGTARLSGLDKWLANRLGIPVRVPEHAEISAVMGCSRTLDEYKKIPDLIESGEKYYGRN